MATKKKAAPKKQRTKKAVTKKKAAAKKKAAPKKSGAKKAGTTKNKLGVKNSLVNNINARKKKGISRAKKKNSVSKKSYDKMENGWK